MSNFSISTKFAAVCCLFVVAVISQGAVANNLQKSLGVKFSVEYGTRQDNGYNECFTAFNNNFPQSCNLSVFFDLEPTSDLSDAQLAEINQAYSRQCISSCIDPLVTFYHCLSTANNVSLALINFQIEFIENGICGQENGDYCPVLFARQNRTNSAVFNQIDDACYVGNTGIVCNSTTSASCLNGLTRTAQLVGCCARPYLGSGIDSCTGVNADPSCNSPANKDNECFTAFNNSLPRSCNSSVLFDLNPTSDLSDAQLAELNQAYSRQCISSCIDPLVTFYHCLSTANNASLVLINAQTELIQNGICGQESGDYCRVLLARQNRTNSAIFDQTDACYLGDVGIVCNSTTSARCLSGLTRTAQLLGCCLRPYLGPGIDSCPGVNAEPSCNSSSPGSGIDSCTGVNADPSCNSPANKVHPLATLSFIAVILFAFFF